jgi:hypothetical protein
MKVRKDEGGYLIDFETDESSYAYYQVADPELTTGEPSTMEEEVIINLCEYILRIKGIENETVFYSSRF